MRNAVAALALLLVLAAVAATVASWRSGRMARPGATDADAATAEPGWLPAAPSDRWQCVVIHHSASDAGGAGRFDRAHRARGWDGLGYHFVIGNGTDTADGQVEVGPRWAEQKHGAHCKTPGGYYNDHGIGVCLVGNFDRHAPSVRQVASLRRLLRFLCRAHAIPADRVYVHGGVTGKTRCPGERFDLAAVRAGLTDG